MSPKWRSSARAPAGVLLDVGPDLAVLAPARAGALLHGRAAERRGAAVEAAEQATGDAVGRGRGGRHDAGPGQMTDERAQPVAVATEVARQPGRVQGVAAVAIGCRSKPVGEPAGEVRVELVALDEVHVQGLVAILGEEQRTRRRAVPPGAAGLLVVGLERRRHGGVHDRAHVGLVHPHAERVGGADDPHAVGEEAALDLGAALALQPRVVGECRLAERLRELRRRLLGSGARARVDDGGEGVLARAGTRRAASASRVRRGAQPRRRGWAGRSRWPLAVARAARAARRRRPPRAEWQWPWTPRSSRAPSAARSVGEAEVVGPEVVPPLRDAVGLVHHEQPDPRRTACARGSRARRTARGPRRGAAARPPAPAPAPLSWRQRPAAR